MKRMHQLTVWLLASTLVLGASASWAQGVRLDQNVAPIDASIDLVLDANRPNYTGTATFSLKVDKPTSAFRMHAQGLKVTLKSFVTDGTPVPLTMAPAAQNQLGLSSKQPLSPGTYLLTLSFSGKVSSNNDHGIFVEKEAGNNMVFTQFEPISAREAFPCFDQPDFKHPWTFSITAPSAQQVFFNTPEAESKTAGKLTTHRFEKTLPLPSYLLAFSAGQFDVVDLGKGARNQVPLRVIVPKGMRDQTHWATAELKRVMEGVEDYFDLPYPYSKLDVLVIPHLISFGAMEHPGLVTFGSNVLLQREADETLAFRQGATETMAHEFAHQWFGDWVTLSYWDDIWLNEAFAQWLGRKVTAALHPQWRYQKEAVRGIGSAMGSDKIKSARKIRQPIDNEGDIANAFDGITYDKGAAAISTVERWMGEKPFQSKVKGYLMAHANGNANSTQFFEAFGRVGKTSVKDVFVSFTDSTGIPLVQPEMQCDKGQKRIRFTLSRYEVNPPGRSAADSSWRIPLCYRLANGSQGCVLNDETLTLPSEVGCDAPIQFNRDGLGYYLVDVKANELEKRFAAATTSEERMVFARELNYAVSNGTLDLGAVLPSVEKWMQVDDWAWRLSLTRLVMKLPRFQVPENLQGPYALFVAKVLGPAAKQVGWQVVAGEPAEVTEIRPTLLDAMVEQAQVTEFVEQAVAYATDFFDHKKLPFEVMEEAVPLAVGARPELFFVKAKKRWLTEKDNATKQVLQGALLSVKEPKLAQEVAALALDSKLDVRETFYFWSGHPLTNSARFDFAEKNASAMMKQLPSGDSGGAIVFLLASGCEPSTAERLERFFRPKLPQLVGGERNLTQAKEQIVDCHQLTARMLPQLTAYLQGKR